MPTSQQSPGRDWLEAELADTLDEDYELELEDVTLSDEIARIYKREHPDQIDRQIYFRELAAAAVRTDPAASLGAAPQGKGRRHLRGPRFGRQGRRDQAHHPAAEPARGRAPWPCPRRRTAKRPSGISSATSRTCRPGGEIVLFDRSWYNRAGVERVMGFADEDQVEQFFHDVPEFERMLVRSGIRVIKYWFSITDEEQQMRFLMRIHDPMKQWKLSPMDLQSRVRWEQYTKAKEEMMARTNIPEAPWYIVEGNDKKRARLNCIDHLLGLIPYEDVPHEEVTLPDRVFNPDYERAVLPPELYVPRKY